MTEGRHGAHTLIGVGVGVDQISVGILGVYGELDIVGVDHTVFTHIIPDVAVRVFQILPEGGEIVFHRSGGKSVGGFQPGGIRIDTVQRRAVCIILLLDHELIPQGQNSTGIEGLGLEGDGVGGHGLLLDVGDVFVDAGGQGQDHGNADDADGAGKGCQQGPALLGQQVVEA